jgi:TPR repeat protein
MKNTVWKLQTVYSHEGNVIKHSGEEWCFNEVETHSDGITTLSFSKNYLPCGGNLTGLTMNARGEQFVVFDFPDDESAEAFLVLDWDRASQTITIADQWGLKLVFKCKTSVNLGKDFTCDPKGFYEDERIIETVKNTDRGLEFLDKGDYANAYNLLIECARAGDPRANLGLYEMSLYNVLKQYTDEDPTRFLYKSACSYNNLALAEAGLVRTRHAHLGYAHEAWQISASMGNNFARVNLARYIYWGRYRDEKPEEAVSLMKSASEGANGEPEAMFWMGVFYYDGYGVEKSVAKALDYFRQGAECGSCKAQYFLGNAYYNRSNKLGLEQDYKKAFEYLSKFVENDDFWKDFDEYQGSERSAYGLAYRNLSAMYRFGRGCSPNTAKANEMIRKANEYGNPDAGMINKWLFGEKK